MRALVTGGSGYLGEILVRRLQDAGRDVAVLDRVDNPDRPPNVEMLLGDVRDRSLVQRAMTATEVVFHAVAQVPLAKSRHEFWSVNVTGTQLVLDAARSAGVRKVVLVSSSAIYGVPPRNPVDRAVVPSPGEDYGRAKLEGERAAERAVQAGLDVSILRPRTILGHGRLGIFQILFEWVRRGRPVYVFGGGENLYQFVHADDLVDACLRAASRPGPATYLVGTDRFGTMRSLLEALVRHAGTGSPIRSLPLAPAEAALRLTSALGVSPLGPYHALMYGRSLYFDVEPTRRELGWAPTRSNEEMIVESYEYYCRHRDEILARSDASHHRSPVRLGILRLLDWLP